MEERLQSGRKTLEPALKNVQAEMAGLRQKVDQRLAIIRQERSGQGKNKR